MEGLGGRDKAGREPVPTRKALLRQRLAEMCDVLVHRRFMRVAATAGCAVALWTLVACGSDGGDDSSTLTPVEEWTTEAEYGFGDQFEGDAVYIKDDRRITRFTLDGELVGTDAFPLGVNHRNAGVQYWAMFNDPSFMALSSIDLMDESLNPYRADHVALLRILPAGSSWRSEILATLSFEDYRARPPSQGAGLTGANGS